MYFKVDEVERRCLPTAELRLGVENDKPVITGYAAVFNTWADIGGWFRESIRPGAFVKTIKENDIRALFNHDEDFVLGRNKAKTLSLREDDKGLAVEIHPPGTGWANDLLVSMRRQDVNQMSFGFTVNKAEMDYDKDERVLTDVTLFDVSVVTYPAYPTTSAQVRALFQNKGATTSASSTTGTMPVTVSVTTFDPTKTSWSDNNGTHNPPGFSELDRIIRKMFRKEELTEEELRVVAAHYPDLSVPPAKHTGTPSPPPAKHVDGDTREGPRWMQLSKKADMLETIQKTVGGKNA
jgi:hypothetical protein